MNAGQPDGPHLTGIPADPLAVVLWQVRASLTLGLISGLLAFASSFRLLTGVTGEAAKDIWLLGSIGILGWTAALFVSSWSRRSALPQRLPVLIVGGAVALGAVAMGVGRVGGMKGLVDLGWLAEAIGGVLVIFLLAAGPHRTPTGSVNLDDLLAPGFRPGAEEVLTDRVARAMVVLAAVDLVLAAFYALGHEEHFAVPTFTGILFWYGWAGSLAWGTMCFFMPRFMGRHLSYPKMATGAFGAWQAGIIGAFAFHQWWILALAALGGLGLVLAFIRPLLGSLRPRPRVVGSRRAYIHSSLRWLLMGAIVLALVAVAAIPWAGPVADGAYRLTSAWVLATLFGNLGHMAFIRLGWRYSPRLLAGTVGIWTLGWVFMLWSGAGSMLGSILMVGGAVATFLVFERNRPQRRDFVVLRGRAGS